MRSNPAHKRHRRISRRSSRTNEQNTDATTTKSKRILSFNLYDELLLVIGRWRSFSSIRYLIRCCACHGRRSKLERNSLSGTCGNSILHAMIRSGVHPALYMSTGRDGALRRPDAPAPASVAAAHVRRCCRRSRRRRWRRCRRDRGLTSRGRSGLWLT
jgi:hypothetical protein